MSRGLIWTTVIVMLGWGVWAGLRGTAAPPATIDEVRGNDLDMYAAVTEQVAGGRGYYQVLATELTRRGYAIRPLFNWRMPTLTWINVGLKYSWMRRGVLIGLGVAVIFLWLAAIWQRIPNTIVWAFFLLIGAFVPLFFIRKIVFFYEIWSGWLLAGSLAMWGLGRWRASVALGAAALAIRELALPYVVVMAVIAWRESRRREWIAWVSVAVVFVLLWALHILRVLQVIPPAGLTNSWVVAGGWAFVLAASHTSIWMLLTKEPWAAVFLVPFAWAGAWHWRDALGRRIALVLSVYFAFFMVAGRPDNWYWGFMITPLLPLGPLGFFFRPRKVTANAVPVART